MKEAQTKITARVSKSKGILLDLSLTVREWLVCLKKDTAPSEGYIAVKTTEIYTEALTTTWKALKPMAGQVGRGNETRHSIPDPTDLPGLLAPRPRKSHQTN